MRIGEVAEQTGLSISNIRFYEKKGLIEPDREWQSKYRDYTEEDVKRLKEILLYRKMDLPIETISLIINGELSIQDAIEQQLLDLKKKQKAIQGSIDLCEKVVFDQTYEEMNVEAYLNYVKEEESKGAKFAEVEELLMDFADFTQFNRMIGDSYMGWLFMNSRINRLVLFAWMLLWIAIPVIGIVDDCLDEGGVSPLMILFWIGWGIFFFVSFLQFRKAKKHV